MDPRKYAVSNTTMVMLTDAEDNPMLDDSGNQAAVEIYGPGSAQYAKAVANRNNRTMDRLRKKGKADLTPEQQGSEQVEFLTTCTKAMHFIDIDGAEGPALFREIYSDKSIGFISDQVNSWLGDWKNFTKPVQTP